MRFKTLINNKQPESNFYIYLKVTSYFRIYEKYLLHFKSRLNVIFRILQAIVLVLFLNGYHPWQWWIQDFPEEGCTNSQKCYYVLNFFAENCMKMKEFWTPGVRVPSAPFGSANVWFYFCAVFMEKLAKL